MKLKDLIPEYGRDTSTEHRRDKNTILSASPIINKVVKNWLNHNHFDKHDLIHGSFDKIEKEVKSKAGSSEINTIEGKFGSLKTYLTYLLMYLDPKKFGSTL